MDQLVRGLRAGPFGRDVKLGDRCDSVPRSIWVRCRIRLPRTSQMMMVGVLILRTSISQNMIEFGGEPLTLDSRMSLLGLMCYVKLKRSVPRAWKIKTHL